MGLKTADRHTLPQVASGGEIRFLCVDLDGALVRADTLHESVVLLLKSNPWGLACALAVLFTRGIAAFKRAVSSRVSLRADLLPYNEPVVNYLKNEAARGRRILLVTAADLLVAEAVARHLPLFEAVQASDGSTNLKSAAKADRISRHLGAEPFEYLGDSLADVPVWKKAAGAIVVGPTRSIRRALSRAGVSITKEFKAAGSFRPIVRAMRIYQWSKNLLVFAPLLLSHRVFETARLLMAVKAFAAFCVAASAIYVINDLLDIDADRQHVRKRHRPFAAGTLTVAQGAALALALLTISLLIAAALPPRAGLLLALYVTASLVYTVYAKRRLFLDVTTLAGLYTIRLLIGGVAAGILISPWTLAFSIFLFSALASCKRLSELRADAPDRGDVLPGRPYLQADLVSLTALACSSGYAAVLVMALYLNSPDFVKLYTRPELMWCLAPLAAYWIGRAIMIANRGNMHDDPIVFAFRDRASQVVAAAAVAIIVASL